MMRHPRWLMLLVALATVAPGAAASASTRIGDIAELEGVRSNKLLGPGLVVGLQGTGDSSSSGTAIQLQLDMMEKFGVRLEERDIKARNVAVVMVTAELPPFAEPGQAIDLTVSAIGDAKSLRGGTLIPTPLMGLDDEIYAVGEGAISVGGYEAAASGSRVSSGHVCAGHVPNGGQVERAVPVVLDDRDEVTVSLNEENPVTATRMARAINTALLGDFARAVNTRSVKVTVPDQYLGRVTELYALLETLPVEVYRPARVVIDERNGAVVMGADVHIAPVYIAYGGLSVRVQTDPSVSQPGPFSAGETVAVQRSDVEVFEENRPMMAVDGATVGDVVSALNALGVTPSQLVVIFQQLKTQGALDAELVVQ